MLFNSALEYTIRKVPAKQDVLKLDVIHHILIYIEYYNILDTSVHTPKKNTEASLDLIRRLVLMQVPKDLNLWSCQENRMQDKLIK